jgi:4-amino-4-deoxy-L-arabinose transferase-like glycosyltransferase
LLTYELGRKSFGSDSGLLAGVMLASATLFCASAHFANPDALLDACTLLALFVFWHRYRRAGPLPFGTVGAVAGLGMLAKGPVALVLPAAVAILFLAWQRELRRLADPRLARAVLTFILVAAPWYTWVGIETKGEWLRGFFWTHNLQRFLKGLLGHGTPLENHGGPIYYYVIALLVGFAPWSIFFGPAAWNAYRPSGWRERSAIRFLLCWAGVFILFFTLSGTKLPNYILPAYPAVALLTGRTIDRWRRGIETVPGWLTSVSLASLALIGVGVGVGLLVAAGKLPVGLPAHRQLPALAPLAPLGMLPVAGALLGWWYLRKGFRDRTLGCVFGCGILFSAVLAALGPVAVDRYKAPRALAAALPADQTFREVRIGAFEYFQPSLVFYCQREVARFDDELSAREMLDGPLPAFLFVPAAVWDDLQTKTAGRELARHHDLYDGRDVVLVSNR